MSASRQAVLLITHVESPAIARHFERLKRETAGLIDAFFCLHQVTPTSTTHPRLATNLLVTAVDGARLLPQRHAERLIRGLRYNEGYADLIQMPACSHPSLGHYEHLWTMEYDVDFAGDWSCFFARTMESRADLLATSIFPRTHSPHWANWPGFNCPPEVTLGSQLRSFLPIARFSRALLGRYRDTLRDARWQGHFEALVATIARHHDLCVADLGGSGPFCPPAWYMKNYRNSPDTSSGSPGTFVFRPVTHTAYFHEAPDQFGERDMLYHPVKVDGMAGRPS
jgi:hypothetical protein